MGLFQNRKKMVRALPDIFRKPDIEDQANSNFNRDKHKTIFISRTERKILVPNK